MPLPPTFLQKLQSAFLFLFLFAICKGFSLVLQELLSSHPLALISQCLCQTDAFRYFVFSVQDVYTIVNEPDTRDSSLHSRVTGYRVQGSAQQPRLCQQVLVIFQHNQNAIIFMPFCSLIYIYTVKYLLPQIDQLRITNILIVPSCAFCITEVDDGPLRLLFRLLYIE